MKILKALTEYIDGPFRAEYWANKYNFGDIETVAFYFLVGITWVVLTIEVVVLFITCPIWIIPYLIYKTVTEKPNSKEAED